MAILGASQLQLHYADLEVFSNVTLQVDEKDRIGLVGPNGQTAWGRAHQLGDGGTEIGIGHASIDWITPLNPPHPCGM